MKKILLFSAVALTTSMVMYSCGGGGGGGSTNGGGSGGPVTTQPITNQDELLKATSSVVNQLSQIANLFMESNRGLDKIGPKQEAQSEKYSSSEFDVNIAKIFLQDIKRNLGKIKSQGSESDTDTCYNGEGTITYKYTWTNPGCIDGYQDACWKNNTITFEETYNNCRLNGFVGDGYGRGQITFDSNGNPSGYIEVPNSFKITNTIEGKTYTFKNSFRYEFNYKYGSSQIESYNNYKSGTIETVNTSMNFNNFNYRYIGENFDQFGDPNKNTITFNGKIYGKLNNKDFEYAAQNLKFSQDRKGNIEYSILEGLLYEGFCNKKWYEFKTVSAIESSDLQPCPSKGKISINNSYSLEFTQAGGINVLNNGSIVKGYASCKDYEKEAKTMVCQ